MNGMQEGCDAGEEGGNTTQDYLYFPFHFRKDIYALEDRKEKHASVVKRMPRFELKTRRMVTYQSTNPEHTDAHTHHPRISK